MSSSNRIEDLQAEVDYYRDRVALQRARLYRGVGSSSRLEEFERSLEGAEGRLQRALTAPSGAAQPNTYRSP